jgi:REP element-mobilizing transposase RayT
MLSGAGLTQLPRPALDNICVSLPRPIVPGSIYLVARRCTQRQFLLKPTPLTSQIFEYCLAVAAERTGVRVHAACVLSNHWHAVVSDPHGRLPVFTELLHKYVAKAVNASLGYMLASHEHAG